MMLLIKKFLWNHFFKSYFKDEVEELKQRKIDKLTKLFERLLQEIRDKNNNCDDDIIKILCTIINNEKTIEQIVFNDKREALI